jgi:hypothetical protein
MADSDQRGCDFDRIARARRATAVYRRYALAPEPERFFRAVIAAHSRAREYAAATPRRSILHAPDPDPDPDPKRVHIGNVFPGPKKHRRPHFDNTAERSPTLLGVTRDQPRDDLRDPCEDDCSAPIIQCARIIEYVIYIIDVIYIIQISLSACRHKS